MKTVFCRECGATIAETDATCPNCGTKQHLTKPAKHELPDGIRGFSWAAFLMNFIWGIGNRVWISLLIILVPLCLSGLLSLFDATRCADETFSKPHPAMLQELTRELGQEVTFTVTAAGTPPFRIQWRKDGADLPHGL